MLILPFTMNPTVRLAEIKMIYGSSPHQNPHVPPWHLTLCDPSQQIETQQIGIKVIYHHLTEILPNLSQHFLADLMGHSWDFSRF